MVPDRVLVTVSFMTWVPASARDVAPTEKMPYAVRLWAPVMKDEQAKKIVVDKLPVDQQGLLWAQNEVIRLRPDGHEVLAIVGIETDNILESTIINQPKAVDDPEQRAKGLGLSKLVLP